MRERFFLLHLSMSRMDEERDASNVAVERVEIHGRGTATSNSVLLLLLYIHCISLIKALHRTALNAIIDAWIYTHTRRVAFRSILVAAHLSKALLSTLIHSAGHVAIPTTFS